MWWNTITSPLKHSLYKSQAISTCKLPWRQFFMHTNHVAFETEMCSIAPTGNGHIVFSVRMFFYTWLRFIELHRVILTRCNRGVSERQHLKYFEYNVWCLAVVQFKKHCMNRSIMGVLYHSANVSPVNGIFLKLLLHDAISYDSYCEMNHACSLKTAHLHRE